MNLPSCLKFCGGEADIRLSTFSSGDGGLIYYFLYYKHCPFMGQLFGSLQLQSFRVVSSSDAVFCFRMVLLCPSMIY